MTLPIVGLLDANVHANKPVSFFSNVEYCNTIKLSK